MDLTQRGILLLLKSAITQQPQELPEGFDMEAAYPLIRQHHMAALCYDGAVRCGVPRQHPVMQEMFRCYCKMLAVSEGQMRQISRIYAAFDANGIDYMPLKGCNMKALYPKPELRTMGDADILIRVEQYDQIVPVMESIGFTYVKESDPELVWKSPALHLELHKRLFAPHNKDFYTYFGEGWNRASRVAGTRYAMTAEDTYIYLLTHFAKHYRDGGIGCRHVVDLWVYRMAHPGMDEAYIGAELEKLWLREFHEHICRMIDAWFREKQMDEWTDVLTAYIFSSGSWGSNEERMLARVVKQSKHSALGFSGRLMYLWGLLFPSRKNMRQIYPVLEKAPFLLPVFWLIRPVHKMLFNGGKVKKYGKNLKQMSKENLDARQEMLRYVGLDYNF